MNRDEGPRGNEVGGEERGDYQKRKKNMTRIEFCMIFALKGD